MKNMQRVSDDEFDKLFHDQLHSYEVEPTDAVWTGISEHLNSKPRTRSFPVLRLAAACMAAAIGFGIWLAANKEPMRLSASTTPAVAPEIVVAPKVTPVTPAVVESKEPVQVGEAINTSLRTVQAERRSGGQQHIQDSQPVPSIDAKTPAIAEVAETETPATSKADARYVPNPTSRTPEREQPVLALATEEDMLHEQEEPQQKSKRIKSVGSLVNFVVGKVDKRSAKIIEFEDSDEGTKVSGVNLGLLKFKAKE